MNRLVGCLLILVSLVAYADTYVYSPDNSTNFCNPERGFYVHVEQKVKGDGKTNLSASTFSDARKQGYTLLLRMYYLDNYRNDSLPSIVLDQIDSDFALFRQHGCKAVLRFAYTNDNDNYPIKDGNPDTWKRHLEQLTPILHNNADVIAVVQAGFLGAWGEWYASSQGTGSGIKQSVKDSLINQLLRAVPASRTIQLRTPNYKRAYMRDTIILDADEAFSGSPRARIGHHNDAFLYQSDNMGTYSNRTKDMAYLNQECQFVPNGGETDVYKESVYQQWATGDKAQAEMAQLHYSYLNQGYCELTLNHWRKDGSFNILARHMGYRFQLIDADLPTHIQPADSLPIRITLTNVGYAAPYNERHAYIVLRSQDTTLYLTLESEPRLWQPNGALTVIDEALPLPSDLPEGDYQIALYLPDASPSIASDPRFAIRMANEHMWEESTGFNMLNASPTAVQPLRVQSSDKTCDAHKVLQNGIFYIVRDGKRFTPEGALVQ